MFAWFHRLRARIRYRGFDADLRQEIETHRALLERDLEARGLSADEARAHAARSLGNVTLAREAARGVWLAPWLEGLWQDARYGVRSLRRSPAFTVTALLTMTIGIGLNTTMFTAFNAVGLRGWPVEHAESLVLIRAIGGERDSGSGFGLDDLADFQRRSRTLAVVEASRRAYQAASIDPAGRAEGVYGQYVTPGFFDATGVRMAMGRNFRSDEDREGSAEPVVIISHALWQRLFAGAPDVLGRPLYFGKTPYVIVGVTREGWRGEQPYRDDAWLPFQAMRRFRPDDSLFSQERGRCCLDLLGRLAPGVSRASAAEELTLLARQRAVRPEDQQRHVTLSGTSMYDRTSGPIRLAIPVMVLAATVIVLLLTGANLAHLQLARAMTRAREIRTRLALGAGRARVARQLVTEILLLTVVACGLAMTMVYALLDTLMRVAEMPMPEVWTPDTTVFGYCVGVSLIMSVTFSLLPALRSTRVSLSPGAGQAATPAGRLRLNLVLLTAQIALSTSLLTGASLLSRAFTHATRGDFGFTIDGLTVATYRPGGPSADVGANARVFRETVERALTTSSLPSAAFVDVMPFSHFVTARVRRPIDDAERAHAVDLVPMSGSAFGVLAIPVIEGRPYVDRQDLGEAVVNQKAARLLWPNDPVIGKTLTDGKRTYTIVGVTRDVHFTSRQAIRPTLHVPAGATSRYPGIVVRGGGPAVSGQLTAIIASVDPGATIIIRSLADTLAARLGDEKAGADAAWAGGLLALALATFGVFGIFAYVVEERRREIGIRVALGAQKRQVLGTLFRSARLAVLAGLCLGLVLSLGVGPMLEQFLFGLSPFDPLAFGIVAIILAAAGFVATFIPARRALGVDPAVILKDDL